MTITESKTRHGERTGGRERELERTLRDALMLAVGKRAAGQALRHAQGRTQRVRHTLVPLVGHMVGYGTLLGYIWYRRQAPAGPASPAGSASPASPAGSASPAGPAS